MLVVKVEIWPGGEADRAREIGRIGLANVSDMAETSDYVVVRTDDRGNEVTGFLPGHRRDAGFWPLLGRALAALDGDPAPVPDRHQEVESDVKDVLGRDRLRAAARVAASRLRRTYDWADR